MDTSTTPKQVRVAILAEERLVLDGLTCLFESHEDFTVVATGRKWDEIYFLASAEPQVTLVDIQQWNLSTLSSPNVVSRVTTNMKFVAIDGQVRHFNLREVLRRGWHGYLTKADSFEDLLAVVSAAARGEQAFSESARTQLRLTNSGWTVHHDHEKSGVHVLTRRETEDSHMLGGRSYVGLLRKALQIALSTVENHKANMMKKLGMRRLTDLVRLAIREGLAPVGNSDDAWVSTL
ncbi:MAG: response regulator transcription factor [Pirellulales bacterium]